MLPKPILLLMAAFLMSISHAKAELIENSFTLLRTGTITVSSLVDGVPTFNTYTIGPKGNLSGADLQGQDLSAVDLAGRGARVGAYNHAPSL